MPRAPRIVVAGVPLHITQRGNDRMATFHCRDDFAHYGAILREASARWRCQVHAYAFMTNHVHLLVTPADERGPARMMHTLGTRYVGYFNARYGRTGVLWGGRYYSTPVDSGCYLISCARYIELNPVRAGMVGHAADYAWSSFRRNAVGIQDALVTSHPVYEALGTTDEARRAAYADFFTTDLDPDTECAIRRATATGRVLGRPSFREELEAAVQRRLTRFSRGGDRRSEQFRARRDDAEGGREGDA